MSRKAASEVNSVTAASILFKVYTGYLCIRINLIRLKDSLDLVSSSFVVVVSRQVT